MTEPARSRSLCLRLIQVNERVFCVQRRWLLSCSYLVEHGDAVVLVDAGVDAKGADVRFGLRAMGREVSDVRAILMTHWHNDHSAGAAAIQRESGARVYYHAGGEERFLREQRARGLRGWLAQRTPASGPLGPVRAMLELAPPERIEADQLVSEGDLVEGAFRVLETPGHELGHVAYLYEPDNVLFAGDALAVAGKRISFMSRALTQDLDAARRSMLRCLELEPAAVCPGHRHPLVDPPAGEFERARKVVEELERWPWIGC